MSIEPLQPLLKAIASNDPVTIRAAIPEPPILLATIFGLKTSERDALFRGLLMAFDTDEDRWELIEAAAMDSISHPERGSLAAIAPYIPDDMLKDVRTLSAQIPDVTTKGKTEAALAARATQFNIDPS